VKYHTLILAIWLAIVLPACQTSSSETSTPVPEAQTVATRLPEPADTATPSPSPTPSPPLATLQQSASPGGTVVLGIPGQPDTLNPITNLQPVMRLITPLLFESLLKVDPVTASLMPGLATDWRYSSDGRQVTFILPSGLRWSDGTGFTAVDVAASLQATQHPDLLKFSQIVAENDTTLTLTFLEIDCAAVTSLATLPLLPADQVLSDSPVGGGPFVVDVENDDASSLALIPNPQYHGTSPMLDGVTIRFIEPEALPIILSEGAGQFHVLGPMPGNVPSPSGFEKRSYPLPQMLYVAINQEPLNENPLPPPLRRALLMALNRAEIVTELLEGEGTLLAGSLLPGHWAANAEDELSPPAYAPDEARLLLTQIGLRDNNWDGWLERDGETVQLSIRLNGKNDLHQRLGWLVSSYYRDLGLFTRAESVPPDSVIDDLFTHDFTLAIFRWPILPDPDQRIYWHSTENEAGLGFNFTSYNNPQVDQYLEQAAALPGCSPTDRAQLYGEVQQILAEERPVDFVVAPHQHLMLSDRLAGTKTGPFAPFTWNATEWTLLEE
jgi:peptide/nickel transport system substrate-binding protein